MAKVKTMKTKKFYITVGIGKRVSLGVCVDGYGFNIDFLCFWLGVEW
jgi:hypothetical protein